MDENLMTGYLAYTTADELTVGSESMEAEKSVSTVSISASIIISAYETYDLGC